MLQLNKKTIGLGLALLLGAATYFTDGDIGAAVKTAFDKDAAKAACVQLLEEDSGDTTE